MTNAELAEKLDHVNPSGVELDDNSSANLRSILRRDWAVRTLDAWALENDGRVTMDAWDGASVVLESDGQDEYDEPSFPASRHAAALAVYPTLPDAVRAELGECP